jgi:hypothetical protein
MKLRVNSKYFHSYVVYGTVRYISRGVKSCPGSSSAIW